MVAAMGPGADRVRGYMQNTDVFQRDDARPSAGRRTDASPSSCCHSRVVRRALAPRYPRFAQPDAARTARMIADLGLREAAEPLSASPQWRKPQRVVVRNLTPELKTWLQDVAPGVDLVNADSTSEASAAAATADAVLGFCEESVLASSPRVRWVQTYNAGVERCLTSDVFRQRGIVLTNMQRIAGPGDGRARDGDGAGALARPAGVRGWRSARAAGRAGPGRPTGRPSTRCRMAISRRSASSARPSSSSASAASAAKSPSGRRRSACT